MRGAIVNIRQAPGGGVVLVSDLHARAGARVRLRILRLARGAREIVLILRATCAVIDDVLAAAARVRRADDLPGIVVSVRPRAQPRERRLRPRRIVMTNRVEPRRGRRLSVEDDSPQAVILHPSLVRRIRRPSRVRARPVDHPRFPRRKKRDLSDD